MLAGTIARAWRGVAAAIAARPLAAAATAAAVFALHVMLPPLVLTVARGPWTFFTFNPWLKRLPEYLASAAPLGQKLDFLSRVALFWFSADGPYGAPEWGFAVDTMDLFRFTAVSVLVAAYGALWLRARDLERARGWQGPAHRAGGVAGALVGALSLSTGPCSVVGCGAPVLPVVGLAFAGLSSGTLALLSALSRLAGGVVLIALAAGIVVLGWRVGAPAPARQVAIRGTGVEAPRGVYK